MGFYPENPTRYHRISKIIELTGWEPKFFYWLDRTVCDYDTSKGRSGINKYCTDIRKSTVDQIFTEIFGYSSFVDSAGEGKAVIKSEENYTHDGRIVELPVTLPHGKVCQRLIDNNVGGRYVDHRPVIVGGKVAGLIVKYHQGRFDTSGSEMHYRQAGDVFNKETIHNIEQFAGMIGMDYGELDMLLDKQEERWYIIDANKTPGGASKVEGLGQEFINAHRPLFK